jgi:EAL domain-containing protein (putative c-di-GMP-specific phosphodiesterase class I)
MTTRQQSDTRSVPCGTPPPTAWERALAVQPIGEVVRQALSEDRLALALQPIVGSGPGARISFHEGLLRILDTDGAVIPAGAFIPAVENTDLGRALDRWTWSRAVDLLTENPSLRLSINLSPLSMSDRKWYRIIYEAVTDDPGIGDRMILEITENAAMGKPERTAGFMQRLRQRGISFALDDFGAGSTSFRHFRDFRFDMVKIDGGYIQGLPRNPDNQILVKALVSIARHFEMFTVAEFVETEEEARCLDALNVDCQQGYLHGRPRLDWQKPLAGSGGKRSGLQMAVG